MDHFLNSFKSVRETPNLVPSSNKGFPKELHEMAKELVRNSQHQYSVLPIYNIIISSLHNNKSIQDIKDGLLSISKYPLCLYLDQDRPEFHQIRTFSGYYTYELKEKLDSFEQILEALGYCYDEPSQLYKLDDKIRTSKTFDDKIAKIGCDLVLALEELDLYVEMSKDHPIDPVVHFTARVPQLQHNYEPGELQYGQNPGVPPGRPIHEGQRYRDESQTQYSNVPQQGYPNPLGNNPDPPRYQPPGSQEPYPGMQHGQYTDPLYHQQDPYPAQNQPSYQGQGLPYNTSSGHENAYPQQIAPPDDPRFYPKPGQTPHRTDPSDIQVRYPRQEPTVQPPYHQNPEHNLNYGNPRHDMDPPMLQGHDPVNPVYAHPDLYAQSQPTHEPAYPTNPQNEYNPPMNYGRNLSGTQGDAFARQAPHPQPQYTHDNPPNRYAAVKPNITDPMHNPNLWKPGQDIRYSPNRQEQAEVDVIPVRRTQPNLFQGNETSGGAQPQDALYGNMPKIRPNEPHGIQSGRDAGIGNAVGERIAEHNRIHLDKQAPPLGEPLMDTRRDAGLPQRTSGDLGSPYPPNTPNKPVEFQITPSRDADDGSKGIPHPPISRDRDASEIPHQSENRRRSQDFSNQNPVVLTPALSGPQYEHQRMGIHSNSARGAASPTVPPKNTQQGNERTMDPSGKKDAFAMTAFGKSGSSDVHELDEKRFSREHKFSGPKEQSSNSPRQLAMPANTPGNANTGGMQPANPQHGTQYGVAGTDARGTYDHNQHPYQQHITVANPSQIEDPVRGMPPPRMSNPNQGFGGMPNPIHRPSDMNTGYGYQVPSQYETPNRTLPPPVTQDFSQGVGNIRMPNTANIPQDMYPREYNPPPNQGAFLNQYEDPHRPLPPPNTEPPAHAVGYHGQLDDQNRHVPGYNQEDFTQGIDNMRIANTANIPQDVYPREYNTPPSQGAYPNQYPEPQRQMPLSNTEDFSQKVDSTQFQNRPPGKTYSATGETQSNLRYGNEPYNAIDNTAYKATGQGAPIDPYINDPYYQKRQYPGKDDFSQPVSDKNTGINDPNPDRSKPTAQPYQREDPRMPHPLDYPRGHQEGFPYDDDLEMMEERRRGEMGMREGEQMRIMEMKRMREHAAYDEPHYPRQHPADPGQHRPYEAPYQPPAQPPAPTTEWTCSYCTLINPPGTRVCNACAKTVESLPQAVGLPVNTLKCTHCMIYNPSTARVCTDCGRGLF